MDLTEYQDKAKSTDIYPLNKSLACHVFGLTNEAGEVVGKLKKIYRDNNGKLSDEKKLEIAYELGDVLWYIAQVATELDLSLDEIAEYNINKLLDRQARNKIQGDGDNR